MFEGRLGIIAGGGTLPLAVAAAAKDSGLDPFIVGLKGNAVRDIDRFPHTYAHPGEFGSILRALRRENCRTVVIVGSLSRPNLFRIRFDLGFVRVLPRLVRLYKGGDDTLLRGIAGFFEDEGFRLCGAHEIAPRLLAPPGAFSKAAPSPQNLADIGLGLDVARTLGAFDIGQAVVVASNYVIAVEAAEGTDAMLQRCRSLMRWSGGTRRGVLVKAPKPGQDLRLDLPAIGPRTVEYAGEAGLAGIAVAHGAVLLADHEHLVGRADDLGLFLYGA